MSTTDRPWFHPRLEDNRPLCDCPATGAPVTYAVGMWGVRFKLTQQQPSTHFRRCKFHGLQQSKRTYEAQITLRTGWLLTRISQLLLSYSTGVGSRGLSIRYHNIVRYQDSPVRLEFEDLVSWMHSESKTRSPVHIARRFEETGRAILSLYQDRKASPRDLNEYGVSHARVGKKNQDIHTYKSGVDC